MTAVNQNREQERRAIPGFILARLGLVERRPIESTTVLCPVHEGDQSTPSLSVFFDERSGWTNFKCHSAGCSKTEILKALRLAPADCAPGSAKYPKVVGVYDYVDASGRLLYQVVRTEPKDFRMRAPDAREDSGYKWEGPGETERVLYNLPAVLAAVCEKKAIYVVEGEKDADALRKLGAVATCNAGGAGKWLTQYTETLRGASVVIIADRDGPGYRHARTVWEALTGVAASVSVVEAAEGKDAADHLGAGKTVDEFVAVEEARLRAHDGAPQERKKPAAREMNGIPDVAAIAAEVTADRGDADVEVDDEALAALPDDIYRDVGLGPDGIYRRDKHADGPRSRTLREIYEDPDALAPPTAVIPRLAWAGRVTLLAAREKSGKSTLAAAGVAALTRGKQFIDEHAEHGTTLWVLLEEHISDLAARALRFRTDPDRLLIRERFGPAMLDELAREIATRRPDVLVIDTLHALAERSGLVSEAISSSQWQPVMRYFTDVARIFNVGVLLLHHGAKATGKYRDSTAIGGGVDLIVEMEVPKSNTDPVRVLRAVGRLQVSDVALRLEGNRYAVTDFPSANGDALTNSATRALEVLVKRGKPVAYSIWLVESGLKPTTFLRAVNALKEKGYVEIKGDRYVVSSRDGDDGN